MAIVRDIDYVAFIGTQAEEKLKRLRGAVN
jgi:hypothetical protein